MKSYVIVLISLIIIAVTLSTSNQPTAYMCQKC